MSHSKLILTLLAVAALAATAPAAHAQFIGTPVIPTFQLPNNPGGISQATPNQIGNLLMLRALQGYAGTNRVQRGAPQMMPYGNGMGMQANQQQPQSTAAQRQQQAQAAQAVADKRAHFEALRAEKKRKVQERAERRKAEAAERRAAAQADAGGVAQP